MFQFQAKRRMKYGKRNEKIFFEKKKYIALYGKNAMYNSLKLKRHDELGHFDEKNQYCRNPMNLFLFPFSMEIFLSRFSLYN